MDDERLSRWRWAAWGTLGAVLLAALVWGVVSLFGSGAAPQRHAVTTVTRVLLPPPPPPPPPPPKPPEPVKEDKPVEQPKQAEPKSAEKPAPKTPAPPKPAAPPGAPLTAEAGSGPNAFGLGVGNGGGDTIGGAGGGGGGGGNGWREYGAQLTHQMEAALDRDPRTRFGKFRTNGRVTVSASGQIVQTELASSGDPAIDDAIREIIRGLNFGPPPAGMPPKLTVKINARPI